MIDLDFGEPVAFQLVAEQGDDPDRIVKEENERQENKQAAERLQLGLPEYHASTNR